MPRWLQITRIELFLITVIAAALAALLAGCTLVKQIPDEAYVEIAKRQVSIRAVGMMGVEPQTGTIFCIFCAVSYDRNVGQAPEPRP